MDFAAVLKKTWEITWKNKGLWLLGILAGCSASGRGNNLQAGSGFRGYDFGGGRRPSGQLPEGQFRGFPELQQFFSRIDEGTWIAVALVVLGVILVLSLVFLILGVIGQGGLIAAFGKADDGARVALGEGFNLGMQYFWKLLGIRIVVWLIGVVVAILVAASLVAVGIATLGIGLICLLPLLCLLIPLAFGVDAYVILTMVAAVEESLGVVDAFRKAWETLRANLGPVIVMALILILGGGILSAILGIPFIGVIVPAILGFALGTDTSIYSGLAISGLCLVFAIPIIILLSGVLTTYTTGAWTLTYRRLTGKAGASAAAPAA
jgi:hypothetical protein